MCIRSCGRQLKKRLAEIGPLRRTGVWAPGRMCLTSAISRHSVSRNTHLRELHITRQAPSSCAPAFLGLNAARWNYCPGPGLWRCYCSLETLHSTSSCHDVQRLCAAGLCRHAKLIAALLANNLKDLHVFSGQALSWDPRSQSREPFSHVLRASSRPESLVLLPSFCLLAKDLASKKQGVLQAA